ncbi:hypothetical protein HAX54_008697 [Datura stramonium]|uniref:Uncharacterized protein n=1 Tax=Datura stramonium TaxID=4076 RepID=A0ABS8WV97_DATST|nr:hypothetical protein [Datura stramonium]
MAASTLTFSGFSTVQTFPRIAAVENTKRVNFSIRSQSASNSKNEGRGQRRIWRRRKLSAGYEFHESIVLFSQLITISSTYKFRFMKYVISLDLYVSLCIFPCYLRLELA